MTIIVGIVMLRAGGEPEKTPAPDGYPAVPDVEAGQRFVDGMNARFDRAEGIDHILATKRAPETVDSPSTAGDRAEEQMLMNRILETDRAAREREHEEIEHERQLREDKIAQEKDPGRRQLAREQWLGEEGAAAAAKGYRGMKVADFILDGRDLAQHEAKVSIHGGYTNSYGLEYLVVGRFDNPTKVLLLTEDAPRETRARLLTCQQGRLSPDLDGCRIVLLGYAATCELKTLVGTKDMICLAVEDSYLEQ